MPFISLVSSIVQSVHCMIKEKEFIESMVCPIRRKGCTSYASNVKHSIPPNAFNGNIQNAMKIQANASTFDPWSNSNHCSQPRRGDQSASQRSATTNMNTLNPTQTTVLNAEERSSASQRFTVTKIRRTPRTYSWKLETLYDESTALNP